MTATQVQLAQLSKLHQPREAKCPCCRETFVTESNNPKTKCPDCRRRRQPLPENAANTKCRMCHVAIRVRAIRQVGNLCDDCRTINKRMVQARLDERHKNHKAQHCPGHALMLTFVSTPLKTVEWKYQMHQPGDRIALDDVEWQVQQNMYPPGARFERFGRAWVVTMDEYGRMKLEECK